MKSETSSKILSAARKVFSEKGFKKTTVQDIISEAGVARATFYKYFSSKRHVFSELMSSFLKNLYETTRNTVVAENLDPDLLTGKIQEGLAIFYRLFLENKNLILVYFQEAFSADPSLYALWDDFDHKMSNLIAGILESGIKMGAFRPMDTDLIAKAMLMLFFQVPYRVALVGERGVIDVESMAREVVSFVSTGILDGDFARTLAEKASFSHTIGEGW